MSGLDYKDFFVHPVDTSHRRYEALRSVFVEAEPMKEVARRFDVSYGTIRNWVSEFCQGQDAGQSPPFSPHHRVDVPAPQTNPVLTRMTLKSKSPMFGRYRWSRDVG